MISVVIPSHRPAVLPELLQALWVTTRGHDVEAIVVGDGPAGAAVTETAARYEAVTVRYPDTIGPIAAWNRGLALARGELLVFAADDLSWHPGWLDAALSAHRTLGDSGLVGFNDLHLDGNALATHYLFDRTFCRTTLGGVMAYPHYRFFANDDEANERAKRVGAFVWAEQAIVEHRHWRYGGRPKDDWDERYRLTQPVDAETLRKRRLAGFPNDFEPAI